MLHKDTALSKMNIYECFFLYFSLLFRIVAICTRALPVCLGAAILAQPRRGILRRDENVEHVSSLIKKKTHTRVGAQLEKNMKKGRKERRGEPYKEAAIVGTERR